MTYAGFRIAGQILATEGGRLVASPAGAASGSVPAVDRDQAGRDAAAGPQEKWQPYNVPPKLVQLPAKVKELPWIGPFAGKVEETIHKVQQVADELEHAWTFLNDFFAKTLVNQGAVLLQADDYRSAARAMARVHEQAELAVARMAGGWEGRAATAALERTREWGVVGQGGEQVLTGMSGATFRAGEEFASARQAAIDAVKAAQGRIVDSLPSVGRAIRTNGWKTLVPGYGAYTAAKEYARQVEQCCATILHELKMLLTNVAVAIRPGTTNGCLQLGQLSALGELADRAATALETGRDPGRVGRRAEGEWPASVMGKDGKDVDGEILGIVWDYGQHAPPGWRSPTPEELAAMGLTPELLKDDGIGFAAYPFVGPDGRIVLVFGGTNFATAADVMEDVEGGMTYSQQSAAVTRVVDALRQNGKLDQTVFGGHSLGGRLASVAAMESGCPAVTFNAAGTSDATIAYHAAQRGLSVEEYRAQLGDQVRTYRTGDDLLYNLQEVVPETRDALPDALGTRYDLPPAKDHTNVVEKVDGHLMPNVARGYDEKYGTSVEGKDYQRRR